MLFRSLGLDSTMYSTLGSGYSWSLALMLLVFIMALQAFVGRQPFDIAEAEQEIMEGAFIEYSGPNLGLFKLYKMLKQMFYAVLFVTIFMPFLKTGFFIADVAIQLVEVLVVIVLIAVLGSTNPRLRIDQAVKYFAVLIFLSLAAVGLSVYGI